MVWYTFRMKAASWYILSVVSGLLFILSLAQAARYVHWSNLIYDISHGYSFYIISSEDRFEAWVFTAAISLGALVFSFWRLLKVARNISKEDWFRTGIITAILVAPILLVVALRWKLYD